MSDMYNTNLDKNDANFTNNSKSSIDIMVYNNDK